MLAATPLAQVPKLVPLYVRQIAQRADTGAFRAKVLAARRQVVVLDQRVAADLARGQVDARKRLADKIERDYLAKGRDVHVNATGTKSTTLRLEYVLFGRPDAYQIQNDREILGNLRSLGFRKIVITDGFDETYTITIQTTQ